MLVCHDVLLLWIASDLDHRAGGWCADVVWDGTGAAPEPVGTLVGPRSTSPWIPSRQVPQRPRRSRSRPCPGAFGRFRPRARSHLPRYPGWVSSAPVNPCMMCARPRNDEGSMNVRAEALDAPGHSAETVPSSSRNGELTPRRSRSRLICSAVFITIGSTVIPASANPGSLSISAIWMMQESQPAPSLKYRITGVPRKDDRATVFPSEVGSVESSAWRASDDTTGREVSRAAVTRVVITSRPAGRGLLDLVELLLAFGCAP